MPNKHTFLIKPISDLLKQEINTNIELWGDPYCGYNSPAQITNDLNPKIKATNHIDALEWLESFPDNHFDGILFDPPYSLRQLKECYESIGIKPDPDIFKSSYYSKQKKEIARIVKPNGKVLCFGWNSNGIGKTNGFQMLKILLIPHGGSHNDTIITVEQSIKLI